MQETPRPSSDLVSVLGELTNTVGKVVKRLDEQRTELEVIKKKLCSPPSSSSDSSKHVKVRPVIRVNN